ncbi:hypothetical protein Hanom_Chr09g00804431 [Helianthus anomalus]
MLSPLTIYDIDFRRMIYLYFRINMCIIDVRATLCYCKPTMLFYSCINSLTFLRSNCIQL